MDKRERSGYPSDVTDEEWAFVAPYLALCKEDAEQRDYPLRAVFNALRYMVRTGGQWRYMPNDLPPWTVVYQQTQRWIRARCFEIMVEDLRMLLREFAGRKGQPTAMILDSRTLQFTPESGARAGYDGAKRRKGSKIHAAVDTLGHLLALHVTPADAGSRASRTAVPSGTRDHGRTSGVGLCRPGLHRTGRRRSGGCARYPTGGGQTYPGQTRLRPAAAKMGGGKKLCLGGSLSPLGARL